MQTLLAALSAIYAVYGMVFVMFVFLLAVGDIAFLEFENGVGATLWVVVFVALALLSHWRDWTVAGLATRLPVALEWGLIYFIIGAIWSVVKWYYFTLRLRETHYKGQSYNGATIPDPMNYAATITMWIAHWPFSLLWTVINDPIRRLVRGIYRQLSGIYRGIARANFKGIE